MRPTQIFLFAAVVSSVRCNLALAAIAKPDGGNIRPGVLPQNNG